MAKGTILILKFKFDFCGGINLFAIFLDFWAKKSGLKYQICNQNKFIELFVQGDKDELDKFNNKFLPNIPHSIFLKQSNIEIVEDFPTENTIKFDEFSSNLITPYSVNSGKNEFDFGLDTELTNKIVESLNNGKSVVYDDFVLSKFDDFDCDFLLPKNLNLLPKIFVADEKSLIALASYEKPIISLKTSALFRSSHENSPLFFKIRAAWDLQIYEICSKINANFIKVKSKKPIFSVSVLDNSFLITQGSDFLKKSDLDFLQTSQNKNISLLNLISKELEFDNKIAVFLSQKNNDFISVFKDNDEYEMLKITLPNTYEELFSKILTEPSGKSLLDKFSQQINLPSGEIQLPNSFFGLFELIKNLFGFKHSVFELSDDFLGQKGVRIDFKLQGINEFDCIKAIKSAISYFLAGADSKIISFGLVESLAYFLSDFYDTIKNELGCENMVLFGSSFECKSLANLTLKLNKFAKFSEKYPLEIS